MVPVVEVPHERIAPDSDSGATPRPPWWLRFAPLLAAGVVATLRIATLTTEPTEWDSALILNALQGFDVSASAPHPPGSFLYVQAGRILAAVTPLSSELALSMLCVVASGAAAGFAWGFGRRIRSNGLGALFALAVTAVPVAGYYGSTIATYEFDYLAGVVLLYCASRVRSEPTMLIWAALTAALAAGVRPSAMLFAVPVLALMAIAARPSLKVLAVAAGVAATGTLLWLVPLAIIQPGGIATWRSASGATFDSLLSTSSWFGGAPASGYRRTLGTAIAATAVNLVAYLPAAAVAILGRMRERTRSSSQDWWLLAFALAIAAPGFFYGAFIHWGKSGYLLMFLPGFLAVPFILAAPLNRNWMRAFAACSAAASLVYAAQFLFAPAILPARLVDTVPVITSSAYWAPFTDTLDARELLERDHRNAVNALREAGALPGDVIVMIPDNGGAEFANVGNAFPENPVILIPPTGPASMFLLYGNTSLPQPVGDDATIRGAARSRTFLLAWNPPVPIRPLLATGGAVEAAQTPGSTVWEIREPVTIGEYRIEPTASSPASGS